MVLAIGGSGPRPARGPLWVDVRDFGAVAGTDCTAAFQAAVDAAIAKIAAARAIDVGFHGPAQVYIPGATLAYALSRPIWVDGDYVEVVGDGQSSRVVTNVTSHPLFIFGLRRVAKDGNTPLPVTTAYRPDLYGKLDATVASGPGQRWGFRSNGDACIETIATPFSAGVASAVVNSSAPDNFAEVRALTFEFAVDAPAANQQFPGDIPLFILGSPTASTSRPVNIYSVVPNSFVVLFDTVTAYGAAPVKRRFDFSTGSATGVQRITVQIDLATATIAAFGNGVQLATTNYLGSGWSTTPALYFAENDRYPCLIGDGGSERPQLGGSGQGRDFNLYGMSLSTTVRYQRNGTGTAQKRVDRPNTAITDSYRYTNYADAGLVGYLTFDDDPSTQTRALTLQGGGQYARKTTAFIIHQATALGPNTVKGNAIRDVQLVGGKTFGQNVCIGQVLDMQISGVTSIDACHAIGQLPQAANYVVRVDKCTLGGTDCGYFAVNQIIRMNDVQFTTAGRTTLRLIGCNIDAAHLFVTFGAPQSQASLKLLGSDYGGTYTFRDLTVDYEGDAYLDAAVVCEAHPYSPTQLRIEDSYFGTIGDVPGIRLVSGLPWFAPAVILLRNDQIGPYEPHPLIAIDGPSWSGEARDCPFADGPTRISAPPGVENRIRIREATYQAPPRKNAWIRGAHVLEVRAPADGQYAQWLCAGTGAYGTASPPTWAGSDVLASSDAALAAYVLNHGYITVALS